MNGTHTLPKNNPVGSAPAGKICLGVDANANPCLVDENGVITYLKRVNPAPVSLTPSAAGTATLFTAYGSGDIYFEIAAGAGSGAYTARYNLPTVGTLEGAIAEGNVDLPASTNPTITFYDLGSGTELAAITTPNGGAAVANFYIRFRFTNGAWICVARTQNI